MEIYDIDLEWNRKFKESFNTARDRRMING